MKYETDRLFSKRITNIKKSFIREILKVTEDPEIISFAGGLPNPDSFPVEEIQQAAVKVLQADGRSALQYSTTEGYYPLRRYIAERYALRKGINLSPDNILITNGSQQALDLIGKVFIDEGDHLIIEKPGYLGAIQAFSIYEPCFHPVTLNNDGIDIGMLRNIFDEYPVKLYYSVPNFQNPSGISYSEERRQQVAGLLSSHNAVYVEDDPYGELRFSGADKSSVGKYRQKNVILLGTFSKIVAPSFRLGWICAERDIIDKMITVKQGADLHTSFFDQRVVHRHLVDNPLDDHIKRIRVMYRKQCEAMIEAIKKYFPEEITHTEPEGGMFLWITLPEGMSAVELFESAIKAKVAFVPGDPFYVDEKNVNTFRLNYSCEDEDAIDEGIKRLSNAIKKML